VLLFLIYFIFIETQKASSIFQSQVIIILDIWLYDFIAYIFRAQYNVLKEECHQIFSLIGSGKFVTAPIISEEGDPILDPIVLQQTGDGKADYIKLFNFFWIYYSWIIGELHWQHANKITDEGNNPDMVKETDQRIIQWKLTLHQIGWFL